MKIVHKLFLSFLVFVLFIWVVGYLAVSKSQEALKRSIGENSAFLVAQTLDKMDRNIHGRIEEMQAYAKDLSLAKEASVSNEEFEEIPDVQNHINSIDKDWIEKKDTPFIGNILNNGLSKTLTKHLEFYKKKYGYPVLAEIYVTNKYGVIIASTGRTSDYLQADEEWYQKAVAEKEFWIGELEYDESSEVFASDIVVNLYDENGNFVGILKGVLNVEEIIKIIKGIEGGSEYETFEVHLINRDGKVIYGKGHNHNIFEDLSDHLPLNKIDSSQGYFEERGWGRDKGKSLFSYALSKGYGDYEGLGWVLFIEYRTEQIFAPVIKLRNNILIISMVVTIFAILTGFFISRRISNPVTKLKNAAIEIGKGKLDVEIEVESHDEMGQLAGSFKEMTEDLKKTTTSIDHLNKEIVERARAEEALQKAHDELERRVEQRTAELAKANEELQAEIAERKRAEVSLRVKESAIASSINGIALADLEGNLTYVNDAFLKMWGYDDDKEVLGKPAIEFWHMEEKAEAVVDAMRDKAGWTGELVAQRKDGSPFNVQISASMVTDEAGKPICMMASFIDISERLRAESALRERTEALERSNRELEQFAYVASHDLQEPLRMVASYTQLLEKRYKGKLDSDADEFIAYAVDGATRMQALINDLLEYSRVGTRGKDLEPTDCTAVLERTLDNLEKAVEESSAKVTYDPLPTVMADDIQLGQLFQNLINNAVKFRS